MKSRISKFLIKNMRSFYVLLFLSFTGYTFTSFFFNYDLLDLEGLQYDADALDFALNWRLAGPISSPNIAIIEIDERSLDALAEEFGRWPWPRSIFADFIFGLEEANPLSVFINILFTDPDINDPDSDDALDYAISEFDNIVLPASRLDPQNDSLSEVLLSQLPFVFSYETDMPVAVLLTFFPSALTKLGLNNLILDDDGFVRRAQLLYREEMAQYKTITSLQVNLATGNTEPSIDRLINWSTDEGYTRHSFSDVYSALLKGDGEYISKFSNKNVIIGLTAPGLAIQRPTPLTAYTNDNYIIASQLDSLLNNKGLKTIPPVIIMLISITFFGFFAFAGFNNWDEHLVDYSFYGFEILSVVVSIVSISYTNYFIDLTYPITSAGLFFILTYAYRYPINERLSGKNSWLLHEELNQHFYYSTFILKNENYLDDIRGLKRNGTLKDIYVLGDFVSSDLVFGDVFEGVKLLVCFHDVPIAAFLNVDNFMSHKLDVLTGRNAKKTLASNMLDCYQTYIKSTYAN